MKKSLYFGVAAAALTAGMAQADAHLPFAVGDGEFSWDSFEAYSAEAPDLSGQSVTVFGPWLSPEAEIFTSMLGYFEMATGADATYTGSDGFEQQIVIDAEAGSPPNIAVFPQPGLAANPCSARSADTTGWTKWAPGLVTTTRPVRPGSIWAPTPTQKATTSSTAFSST